MTDRVPLTPDNLQLSRVINDRNSVKDAEQIAVDCNSILFRSGAPETLTDETVDLLRHSLSENSQRAIASDLAQFQEWGGTIPATPETVCAYIADHAGSLAISTITRRVATLSKAHEVSGHPNPCRTEIVRATLRGLNRKHGSAQKQAKPLLRDDLFLTLDALGDSLRDQRDRALLLLGFAGGFRRSELVSLEHDDIETARQGIVVTLRRAKTDQEGVGRKIGISHGRTRHCPVMAIERWITVVGIESGPLFRPITRHGHLAETSLSGDAVSAILRERIEAAGIDPEGYSSHSLRAGFATSAAKAGVSTSKIRAQTGHASDAMLARYIRDGEMFEGNAVSALL